MRQLIIHVLYQLFWENLRKQLKSLLDSKPPSPPVPLAILAVGTTSLDTIATNLHLEDFLKADSVSDCYVSILPMNMLEPNSTHVLLSSFQWLAEHCPPSPILTIESFGHFLATMITTCFTSLICHYVKRENSTHLFNLVIYFSFLSEILRYRQEVYRIISSFGSRQILSSVLLITRSIMPLRLCLTMH